MAVLVRREPMPRQFSSHQVDHYVWESLKVVSSALFFQQMRVETWKPYSSHKVGLLALWDMSTCLRVDEVTSKSEIKQVNHLLRVIADLITLFVCQRLLQWLLILWHMLEDEVLGFYVSVDYTTVMNLLKSRQLQNTTMVTIDLVISWLQFASKLLDLTANNLPFDRWLEAQSSVRSACVGLLVQKQFLGSSPEAPSRVHTDYSPFQTNRLLEYPLCP